MLKDLFVPKFARASFSQCGEDLIISHIFQALSIQYPSYIDVGAYHPFHLSNTAYFYKRGCKGINIEPDPALFAQFPRNRPRDINLNIGISTSNGTVDFYQMTAPTLNTFSREDALTLENEHNVKIKAVKKIPVETLSRVIHDHWNDQFPDLLSLDAEGYDLELLKTIDYALHSPLVICVETISYSTTGHGVKEEKIIQLLKENGYFTYADTYINTIFVKRSNWEK